jgi:hypothetical protein
MRATTENDSEPRKSTHEVNADAPIGTRGVHSGGEKPSASSEM